MRTLLLSSMLLTVPEGRAAAQTIPLTPESVNEGCVTAWDVTEHEGRTLVSFSDLDVDLSSQAGAQVKHCRVAWKPVISPGCYAPSAGLVIRGRLRLDPASPSRIKTQLRVSHDLLGQGNTSSIQTLDVKEGSFEMKIDLPEERFQTRWSEVKLVSHVSLVARVMKEERSARAKGQLSIQSMELEPLRGRECPPGEPRR